MYWFSKPESSNPKTKPRAECIVLHWHTELASFSCMQPKYYSTHKWFPLTIRGQIRENKKFSYNIGGKKEIKLKFP